MLKRLHLLPIAALCLSLYLPARADETRDKLRGLVRLPPMSSAFKFSYSHLDGYTLQIAPDAPTVTPDSLRKMLHGNAADAFLYYRIGSLCNDNNKPAEAKAAYAQSVALYRQQVKAAPADGLKWANLALALDEVGSKAERDKAMTAALVHAPNNAQVWDARAQLAFAASNAALSGQAQTVSELPSAKILMPLLKQPQPKAKLRAALSLLGQAKVDYEKAVEVAPNDWHGYSNRWIMRVDYRMRVRLINIALQKTVASEADQNRIMSDATRLMVDEDGIRDLVLAARLTHEEPRALGMAAYFLVAGEALRKPAGFDFQKSGAMRHLSEAGQKTERDLMERLEKLTSAANHAVAGESALSLGILRGMLLSPEQGRAALVRAHTLLPDDPNVVEYLAVFYMQEKKYADAENVLKAALQRRESARWRLMAARTEELQNRWDDVEQNISVAFKNEPKNLDVNLAQCAVLLRKATDDTRMLEFSSQARQTRELFASGYTDDQKFSFNYLGGIYYALDENSTQARRYLKDAQGTEEQNGDVKAILALLPPEK